MAGEANPPQTGNNRKDGGDLEARLPAMWIFALCALVVIVSLAVALYVLFLGTNASMLQARLAITFACFAISCAIGLLFASTAQKSEVRGKLGLSLVIIGPGAFFIACLIIYAYLFPEDRIALQDPMSLQHLSQIVTDVEKRSGWIGFADWLNKVGGLRDSIVYEEESTVELTLGALYFHGDQQHKLRKPSIQTVFVYGRTASHGNTAVLKIQRISGSKGQNVAQIYYNAVSTTPGSRPELVFLVKHPNNKIDVHGGGQNWAGVSEDFVDCMIVAVYPETMVQDGDLILVDPTKYFAVSTGSATVDLVVLSPAERSNQKLWELCSSATVPQDELPILFREFHSEEKHDSGEMLGDKGVTWWLERLEKISKEDTSGEKEEQLLKSTLNSALNFLHSISPELSFKTLLQYKALSRASYHLGSLRNPVMATFQWSDSTPDSASPVNSPLPVERRTQMPEPQSEEH